MSQKNITRIGWALTIILGFLFSFSAFMKLTLNESAVEQAASMGFSPTTYRIIGIVEVLSLILFIIPKTSIVGSFLLVAYLGGAIASHLQHQQPIAMAVFVQALLWITIILRFPEIRKRFFLQTN